MSNHAPGWGLRLASLLLADKLAVIEACNLAETAGHPASFIAVQMGTRLSELVTAATSAVYVFCCECTNLAVFSAT